MKKDVIWGYLAQFLNIGSGLILIPVALRYLDSEDMGLWYLFLTMLGLAQLLEFGFQPTISRMTSYVYAGANELYAEGIPPKDKNIDYQLLYDLQQASKKLYKIVALLVLILLFFIGTVYLNTFESFGNDQKLAWFLFLFSNVINFYFTYFNGLLIGRGDQKELYRIMTISKLIMLFVSSLLLFLNYGLVSMSVGVCFSIFYSRYMLNKVYYLKHQKMKFNFNLKKDYIKVLWLASYKLGITGLGAFLIQRSSFFIVSSYFGLSTTAKYGVTFQVISVLSSLSSVLFYLNLPRFNTLQSNGDKKTLKKEVPKQIKLSLLLYTIGGAIIIFFGFDLLSFISNGMTLLDTNIIILMLIIAMLEMNHSLWAQYLTTLNIIPFAKVSIVVGIITVIASLILVNYSEYGLIGLVICQGLIQLSFSNWYWPLIAYKDLNQKTTCIK
ncbi:O-unit flippase-like protein [Aliivibrio fischeri]|uniref:O-unit flippase-like protein n=1 Tax=Aliivibrio fischeri TaxID=668 RepID=UPI0012DA991C|nr:O-unit flippase-like protein [Aliivibrio fischeri]